MVRFLATWGGVVAARQAGLACDRFRAMQAVILATSGTNSLQSRKTSGVQACCACAETSATAGVGAKAAAPSRLKMAALPASESSASFLGAAFFIGEPVPFGALDCEP